MNHTNQLDHFSSVEDYRGSRYIKHSLLSIVDISIYAIICGAEDWHDVEDYARSKIEWLRTFLDIGTTTPFSDFSVLSIHALSKIVLPTELLPS